MFVNKGRGTNYSERSKVCDLVNLLPDRKFSSAVHSTDTSHSSYIPKNQKAFQATLAPGLITVTLCGPSTRKAH